MDGERERGTEVGGVFPTLRAAVEDGSQAEIIEKAKLEGNEAAGDRGRRVGLGREPSEERLKVFEQFGLGGLGEGAVDQLARVEGRQERGAVAPEQRMMIDQSRRGGERERSFLSGEQLDVEPIQQVEAPEVGALGSKRPFHEHRHAPAIAREEMDDEARVAEGNPAEDDRLVASGERGVLRHESNRQEFPFRNTRRGGGTDPEERRVA